ncbi:MAG: NAD(P)H-binding protein [Anaerolineales bacterium]|nr:NAD(P)H-binding protein [Anaerolineales bacterium]MCB0029970.1 NAD(P)H-binding protein [Anaerolineales bacterium]MCB8961843.1 NAD(P)H-binding protein [Ardenticatenales bacterium]
MILVTGATGFVGRSLMRALATHGVEARPFTGRITNSLRLREQLNGVDTVIHLATGEAHNRIRRLQTVDVQGTETLIRACELLRVRRLIYLSRLGADADALYPLLRAKGEAERYIRRAELDYTIVRSATLFGREDHFINAIAGAAAWSWPFAWLPDRGRLPLQPLWVEDAVRVLLRVAAEDRFIGQTIQVAGDERLHYREIVKRTLAAAGMRRIPLPLPILLARLIVSQGWPWRRKPALSRFFMDRFSVPEVTDLDLVYRQFGFQPARLADQLAFLRRGAHWRRVFVS